MANPLLDASGCPAWGRLEALGRELSAQSLSDLFRTDEARHARLSRSVAGLLFDFSRQRIDARVLAAFAALADELGLRDRIRAMFSGAVINTTEGRAVLHTALRGDGRRAVRVDGQEVGPIVLAERARMLGFAEGVRGGRIRSSSGEPFERVVNIGIGGSDLGPAMAVQALRAYAQGSPAIDFVSTSTAAAWRMCSPAPIRSARCSSSAPRPSRPWRRWRTRALRVPGSPDGWARPQCRSTSPPCR